MSEIIYDIKKTGNPNADAVIGAAATVYNMMYPSIESILRRDMREVEADAIAQLCEAVLNFHMDRPHMVLVPSPEDK